MYLLLGDLGKVTANLLAYITVVSNIYLLPEPARKYQYYSVNCPLEGNHAVKSWNIPATYPEHLCCRDVITPAWLFVRIF